jgi:hypothetical protein
MVKTDVLQPIMEQLVGVNLLEITFSEGIIMALRIQECLPPLVPNRMPQAIDQIILIAVVPLSQQVQIGQVARTTTYDEGVVAIDLILSLQGKTLSIDNDRVQVGITYQVQENGINC